MIKNKRLKKIAKKHHVSNKIFFFSSSNVNEVIGAILNLFFLRENFTHIKKHKKHDKHEKHKKHKKA